MRPEDLDERDLEGRDLAMHEDACEVELHLEAHIHGRPAPPPNEVNLWYDVRTAHPVASRR